MIDPHIGPVKWGGGLGYNPNAGQSLQTGRRLLGFTALSPIPDSPLSVPASNRAMQWWPRGNLDYDDSQRYSRGERIIDPRYGPPMIGSLQWQQPLQDVISLNFVAKADLIAARNPYGPYTFAGRSSYGSSFADQLWNGLEKVEL